VNKSLDTHRNLAEIEVTVSPPWISKVTGDMARSITGVIDSTLHLGDCNSGAVHGFVAYTGASLGSLKFLRSSWLGERIGPPRWDIYREEKEAHELCDGWAFTVKLPPDGRRQIGNFEAS
jgi:hypothetical protein